MSLFGGFFIYYIYSLFWTWPEMFSDVFPLWHYCEECDLLFFFQVYICDYLHNLVHYTSISMFNCFFNILQLVLTVMDVVLLATRRPQFGTKFQTICNAPSVISFRKHLKTYYFGHLSRPPDGCHVLSGSLIRFDTARYVDIDFD